MTILVYTSSAYCASASLNPSLEEFIKPLDAKAKAEDPYQTNYFSLGVHRNFPEAFGDQFLRTDKANPYVGFMHNFNGSWLMGFFLEFKMFSSVQREPDPLPIWTIGHEALWSWRIYHPLYLVLGPQILYLMPTERAWFPLRRSGELPSEIGVGAVGGLNYVGSSRFVFSFLVDRWRGTATQRLQGSELKFVVSWAPFTY